MWRIRHWAVIALVSLAGIQAWPVIARECQVVGQLYSIDGDVAVQRGGTWEPAALNQALCARDAVRTGPLSRAAIVLINQAVLRIDQDTTVYLASITTAKEASSVLNLPYGSLQSFSRKPNRLEVDTPYLNAAIEGTEFVIRTEPSQTRLTVFEGIVAASNKHGRLKVRSGQSVVASAGHAPRPFILVHPRDAVQWSLYYPPILAIGESDVSRLSPEVAASFERAKEHDISAALAAIANVPPSRRNYTFYLYRAALLMSVGRVDEARKIIDRVLAKNPRAGLAYALRAIIKVVQNDKAGALSDARRGVEFTPNLAAPRIALSYAQQASFDLKGARDTLLEATERFPENPLAWARLGELWLMFGYRNRAQDAAQKGVQLAPNLERVHLVFGFAALTEFRTRTAQEAFKRAIDLDSADPLARFGLGLAIIRDGNLAQGRRQLEMAVGLDSSNSLLRSYLGKAYFEEKRGPLDGEQFAIAKELDPLDPTPYLYDAIRLQSINRPVEAMQNMEKSIELNDNRLVYRSRELLDSDRATRQANLAQIFDDLGFEQIALVQGYDSLILDPGNTSAHRFLSDAYVGVPRREIARVSELLQAQMLQDININPVQPSLAETNLSLATRGGPFKPGFNEYTPLFERNDLQLLGAGLLGTQDTQGAEGIASALYNRFSLSAGAFRYETDGWRPNNGFQHDIYNFFMQAAATPDLNMQVELRHRESDEGDLAFNFDPELFNPDFVRSLENDTARAGVRYSPSPHSDLLFSYIYSQLNQAQTFFPGFQNFADETGSQIEAQYIYSGERLNFVAGIGDTGIDTIVSATGFDETLEETDHLHGYVYTNIQFLNSVTWTLGVSYDDFEDGLIEVEKFNPKLGVSWDVTSDLTLRAAAFNWVKPPLIADRTLEPTQVSGFNQVFDNSNGDEAWRHGVGVDWRLTKQLFVGAEATWRTVDVPLLVFDGVKDNAVFEDWEEELHRAYLYWAPSKRISLVGGVVYDAFESDEGFLTSFSPVPKSLETLSFPVGVRYFDPSGFLAGVTVTRIKQEVVRTPTAKLFGFSDGREDFTVVDASIGWRFPKRFGTAILTVNNLFDEKFRYQDDGFREFRDEPSTSPYIPERRVVGRVSLYF